MPKLALATLAHGAQEVNGMLSMLGGFIEAVQAPQMPLRQLLWFVARFQLEDDEVGAPLIVVVKVEHPDGEQIARVDAEAVMHRPAKPDPDLLVSMNLVFPLNLEFRRPGSYRVVLAVNGDQLATCPLKVSALLPPV